MAILDAEDPFIAALRDSDLPGAARRQRIRLADAPADLRDAFDDSLLAGSHNLENVLCAAAAAEAVRWSRRLFSNWADWNAAGLLPPKLGDCRM